MVKLTQKYDLCSHLDKYTRFSGQSDTLLSDEFQFQVVDDILYEVKGRKFRVLPIEEQAVHHQGRNYVTGYCYDSHPEYCKSKNFTILGYDVALHYGLQETDFFTQIEHFQFYLDTYIDRIKYKLTNMYPLEVELFSRRIDEVYKSLLQRHKDFKFYLGGGYDHHKGMVVLMETRPDDFVLQDGLHVFIYFKHGLRSVRRFDL